MYVHFFLTSFDNFDKLFLHSSIVLGQSKLYIEFHFYNLSWYSYFSDLFITVELHTKNNFSP